MTSSESIAGASRSGRLYRHSPLVLFAAGFISVVVFQQGCLGILNALGLTPAMGVSRRAHLAARSAANLVVCVLGWGMGSDLRLLREAVSRRLSPLLRPGYPLWSSRSRASPWPPGLIRPRWPPTSSCTAHGDWEWGSWCATEREAPAHGARGEDVDT